MREIIGRYGGLVRDEDVMRRVNLIGRSLARYSSRPNLEWQFAVLNSDTVNAFSAPGGLVFITLASRHIAAAPLSLIMLIEAVGGVLWTWLGVGEAPAGLTLIGALLVLLAALGNALYGLRRRRRPALAG